MDGFIRLNRKFFKGKYWEQKRTFSLAEAWLDLIFQARFEGTTDTKILANGREINIKRGEIHASLRYLARRWGWGVEKTKRFIDNAKKEHAVEHRTEQGESILKLCNYDSYNPLPNTDRYTNQYTDRTPTDTPTDTPTSTNNKKDKKEKNERETSPAHARVFSNNALRLIRETEKELNDDALWLETIAMNNRLTLEQVKASLIKFFKKLSNEGVELKSISDAKAHFARWLKLNLPTKNNQGNVYQGKF